MKKIYSLQYIKIILFIILSLYFKNSFSFNQSLINNSNSIVIGSVGDVMIDDKFLDQTDPLSSLEFLLDKSDINIFNFEGGLVKTKHTKCNGQKNCHTFLLAEKSIDYLKKYNFSIANLSNNHSLDFGESGLLSTIKKLNKDISIIGAKNNEYATKYIHNQKIVIIGGSIFNNVNHLIHDHEKIKKIIKQAKNENSIVIFHAHIGAEGENQIRTPNGVEYFLGMNRGNTKKMMHDLIDSGVDVIFGHGPHVLRGVEIYKNKPIFYSLGNFLTTNGFIIGKNSQYGAFVQIYFKEKEIDTIKFYGTRQIKTPGSSYIKLDLNSNLLFKNITQLDFPNQINWINDYEFKIKSNRN